MSDNIRLEIVTPEREVFHAMVARFSVPASVGSTGVWEDHAPLVTALVPGVLRYIKEGQEGRIAVGAGFLEVHDNEAEILVATAELPEEIDRARAESARDRASQRLSQRQPGLDEVRARAALARALARLEVSMD